MRNWRYERTKDDGIHVVHAHVWGPTVSISCSGNLDFTEPDMRLIAAAPELLEALLTVRDYVVTMKQMGHEYQVLIDSAIAKATGETP